MNKKYYICAIAMLSICATAFVITIYGSSQETNTQYFNKVAYDYMQMTRLFYETTLEGLEYRSTNIVRGRIADDARVVLLYHENNPSLFVMGHNLVSLEILDVIMGDLSVGDVITIIEPYYIRYDILFTHSNYLPSIPQQEYFFFLSAAHIQSSSEELEGAFSVVHGDRARFPVPRDRESMVDYTAADLSLARETVNNLPIADLHMNLWHDVIESYMDWSLPLFCK